MTWEVAKNMFGILLIGGLLWYMFRLKPSDQKQKESLSDLFQLKRLERDGFIITEDNRYAYMLEVNPVSFELKSQREQKMIWLAFRDWLNMLPHPVRLRIEDHPYDLNEYFQDLKAQAITSGSQHDLQYIEQMQATFADLMNDKKVQDKRYYIILETDSRYLLEQGFASKNPVLGSFVSKAQSLAVENEDVARQELQNSIRVTQSILFNVGIYCYLLNRDQVLESLYRSGNREMASIIPYANQKEYQTEQQKKASIGKVQFGGDVA